MADWLWPWAGRARRREQAEEALGAMRQESANALAELRRTRRSLEAAIEELMTTQAERGDEDHDHGPGSD